MQAYCKSLISTYEIFLLQGKAHRKVNLTINAIKEVPDKDSKRTCCLILRKKYRSRHFKFHSEIWLIFNKIHSEIRSTKKNKLLQKTSRWNNFEMGLDG